MFEATATPNVGSTQNIHYTYNHYIHCKHIAFLSVLQSDKKKCKKSALKNINV